LGRRRKRPCRLFLQCFARYRCHKPGI
jgi:hypothetical protein